MAHEDMLHTFQWQNKEFSAWMTEKCYLLQRQLVLLEETRTVNAQSNILLQENKAILFPVVPVRYSRICQSQAESKDKEVVVLFSYHLKHKMSQSTKGYMHLAASQVHTKQKRFCTIHQFTWVDFTAAPFVVWQSMQASAQTDQFCFFLNTRNYLIFHAPLRTSCPYTNRLQNVLLALQVILHKSVKRWITYVNISQFLH